MRWNLFFFFSSISIAVSAEHPNVLFIAVDDLRPEMATYSGRAVTPHLDAFASTAVRFDRAYCQQAVCGASRVSLMTGLYPEFTGERSFHVTDWRQRWKDVVTLNQHFLTNGYKTVGLGKIYHNSRGAGVDEENWTSYLTTKASAYASPESLKQMRTTKSATPGGRARKRGPATESGAVSDEAYTDGKRALQGAAELKRLAKQEEPFFLAVGLTKPHLPFVAPEKYWKLYERDQFAMPSNLGVPPGYPGYAREQNAGELRSYSDIPREVSPTEFPEALNKRLIHGYHACVSYMDANVGVLLKALEESGEADNTIVVFWGDHGWKLGDHASWCKHTNFECDTRVPLLVRVPGEEFSSGSSSALVELIDLYPTLCEIAGLEKPPHLQGRSFRSILKDPNAPHRKSAYSSYGHRGPDGKPVVGHSLRTAQFRYTEWWEKANDRIVDVALTEIAKDPGETTSALLDEQELSTKLSKQLRDRVFSVRRR